MSAGSGSPGEPKTDADPPGIGAGALTTFIGAGASKFGRLIAISLSDRVSSYTASALDQLASVQHK